VNLETVDRRDLERRGDGTMKTWRERIAAAKAQEKFTNKDCSDIGDFQDLLRR
jgi:hypothetical protein